mgnify:CR=1 FL=1
MCPANLPPVETLDGLITAIEESFDRRKQCDVTFHGSDDPRPARELVSAA